MTKNKKNILFLLLESFTEKELKKYKQMVESPFFNTDSYAIALFKQIWTDIDKESFGSETMQKKWYEAVFKEKVKKEWLTQTQQKLYHAKLSVLTKLAKRFLQIEALENDGYIAEKLLLEQLYNRKLSDVFVRQLKKAKKKYPHTAQEDVFYHHAFQVEKIHFLYKNQIGKPQTGIENLQRQNEYLDMYYLLQKLDLQGTTLSLPSTSNEAVYNAEAYEYVSFFVEKYKHQPIISTYATVIRLMQTKDIQDYTKLSASLQKHQSSLPEKALRAFYTVCANFCIQKSMQAPDFRSNLYEIYKKMDALDLHLSENGTMDVMRLKNLVGVCCQVHDFERAKQFIVKYLPTVAHPNKKEVREFNLGVIAFYEEDYEQAIHHLIRVEKVNVYYDLNARIFFLKALYNKDQEYDERTMTKFRSAEQFIRNRQNIGTNNKRAYKNFVRLLITLYRIRHKTGKSSINNLITKINHTNYPISDRKWLLDKAQTLQNPQTHSPN